MASLWGAERRRATKAEAGRFSLRARLSKPPKDRKRIFSTSHREIFDREDIPSWRTGSPAYGPKSPVPASDAGYRNPPSSCTGSGGAVPGLGPGGAAPGLPAATAASQPEKVGAEEFPLQKDCRPARVSGIAQEESWGSFRGEEDKGGHPRSRPRVSVVGRVICGAAVCLVSRTARRKGK